MKAQDPFGHLAFSGIDFQMVPHVDTADDQYLAVQLNFACSL